MIVKCNLCGEMSQFDVMPEAKNTSCKCGPIIKAEYMCLIWGADHEFFQVKSDPKRRKLSPAEKKYLLRRIK